MTPLWLTRPSFILMTFDKEMVPQIKMLGYQFDFERIIKRIVKMSDNPDKRYVTAPLKRKE